MFSQDLQGLCSGISGMDFKAFDTQDIRQGVGHGRIIINNKNGYGFTHRLSLVDEQKNSKRTAFSRLALHLDPPAVSFGQLLTD